MNYIWIGIEILILQQATDCALIILVQRFYAQSERGTQFTPNIENTFPLRIHTFLKTKQYPTLAGVI